MSITKISPSVVDFDAGITISTADNTDTLTLTSTDADANAGPNLNLYRNSGSPADNDVLGYLKFTGVNDNSEIINYARIRTDLTDASDGTEDGSFYIFAMNAGTERTRISVVPSETVFNDESQDVDFRVESDANANRLLVDAGNDKVLIGTTATRNTAGVNSVLSIEGTGYDSSSITMIANSADSNGAYLMIGKSRGSSLGSSTALNNGDQIGGIYFCAADGTDIQHAAAYITANIYGDVGTNDVPGMLRFFTTPDGSASPTEKVRILPSGGITFNGDTSTANALDDYEEGTWTPVLSGVSTAGTFSAGTGTAGRYIKIGKLCYVAVSIRNSTLSSASGTLKISGLPYATYDNNLFSMSSALMMHNFDFNINRIQAFYAASDFLYGIESIDGGAWTDWAITNSSALYLQMTCVYEVDE